MKKKLIYILLLFFSGISANSSACRYTVCEIGYSDFGTDNYTLILFQDGDVNNNSISIFKKTTYAALLDANIESKVVDLINKPDSSYSGYYRSFKEADKPLALLVSPRGDVLPFYLDKEETEFQESVWKILEDITSSLTRIQILNSIIKSYAVVLFVEGKNNLENEEVLQTIKNSVKEITVLQEKMPKPFENPAEIITLKRDQLENEQVLLWSLGWKKEFSGKPAVAVMYGRGRLMGQLLINDLVQKKYINNLLTLVGADCECGLERSWILGRMMPLRWNKKKQQEVIRWHKFDAENPLVKAEMSKILSISPSKERKQGTAGTTSLYGYTESEMKIVDSYNGEQPSKTVEEITDKPLVNRNIIYLFTALCCGILAIGVFLLVKRKD